MTKQKILLIVLVLLSSWVSGATLEVCEDCTFVNLPEAVDSASDGDQIFIKRGVYIVQELVIEKALIIRGEEGAVLDGQGSTILYVHHDSVSISDLELKNVSTNYVEDRAALKCNDSDFLSIKNIKIRSAFFGLLIEKSKHGIIENCSVEGDATLESYLESANGNAIHLWYCEDMLIINNRVTGHRDGIYFEFVKGSKIEGNWSEGNMRYGLHFMFSHENTYHQNTFYRNGSGVAVMYSDHVIMTENRFVHNWGGSAYGILLKDITDSELHENLFDGNTIAISADNSSRLVITGNRFEGNGYALRIMGNCTDNLINENDFLQNSFDVTTNSSTSYNDFTNNYWEEYTGYDLDRDGLGDIPFRPVKLFTYIIAQSPASILLMRSSFIDLLNLAEKVTPVITPENLVDLKPSMRPNHDHLSERQ